MGKLLRFIIILIIVYMVSINVLAAELIDQSKLEKIDHFVAESMDKFDVPGMALVIVQDGEIIFEKGYGVQAKGTEIKVDANTNFCLASVSKSFTALAILQLRDQGQLSLDDPVIKYLPWFASKDKVRSDKITIRHLIHHISGIPTTAYGLEIENGTEEQLEEQIKKLKNINLFAEPGTRWQYSNLNYWTQALIIEKLTGQKFADYMNQHVFKPMGMGRTGYYHNIADLGNLSSGHRLEFGNTKFFDYRVPDVINAAGGLYSNAHDLGQYLKTILNSGTHGDNQILSANSMREAYTNGVELNGDYTYAFGFYNGNFAGHFYADHGGDNPNFTAHIAFFSADNLGWAILSNSQHPMTHTLSNRVARIVLDQEVTPIGRTSAENTAQLAGMILYVGILLGLILVIWLIFMLIGLGKKRFIFTSKMHLAKLIIQVIIVPIIGLGALFCGVRVLPVNEIGSYRIAMLYQPDLVKSLTITLSILAILTILIGFRAFLRKKSSLDIDPSRKSA